MCFYTNEKEFVSKVLRFKEYLFTFALVIPNMSNPY